MTKLQVEYHHRNSSWMSLHDICDICWPCRGFQ